MPAPVHAQTLLAAIRAGLWPQAEALAATDPDPLALKLVRYYRLLTPGAARAAEIAAFMAENPEWPQQALLSRRLQEALAIDHDDRTVLEICRQRPPQSIPSLLRCADATTLTDPPCRRRTRPARLADRHHRRPSGSRLHAPLVPPDHARRPMAPL